MAAASMNERIITQATRNLILRPYTLQDQADLYAMCCNTDTLYLWSPGIEFGDFERFKARLERRIEHRWDHYAVFEHRKTARPAGFAYCYNTSHINKITYLCIYLDQPYIGTQLCLEAAYLYLDLLLDAGYRKLYAEVFAYNTRCLKLLHKVGFKQEGCLRAYQFWQEKYWNQYIFSIDRQQIQTIYKDKRKILAKFINE